MSKSQSVSWVYLGFPILNAVFLITTCISETFRSSCHAKMYAYCYKLAKAFFRASCNPFKLNMQFCFGNFSKWNSVRNNSSQRLSQFALLGILQLLHITNCLPEPKHMPFRSEGCSRSVPSVKMLFSFLLDKNKLWLFRKPRINRKLYVPEYTLGLGVIYIRV